MPSGHAAPAGQCSTNQAIISSNLRTPYDGQPPLSDLPGAPARSRGMNHDLP
jgi:hypothetical protein